MEQLSILGGIYKYNWQKLSNLHPHLTELYVAHETSPTKRMQV
ncbi:MAG: hypothetical protein V3T79_02170 [Candidatus Scalindua sediminis]